MATSKKVLILLELMMLADFIQGQESCKDTVGKKYCKKRKGWCFKAELQQMMLAGCRRECGLCNAPECKMGQMVGEDNQCVDLDCPIACEKKTDMITEQLGLFESEMEDLKKEHSSLKDRVLAMEEKLKEKRYTIIPTLGDWNNAKAQCASLSEGALAEATTFEEHEKIRSLLVTSGSSDCSEGYWVAGEDAGNGVWRWITSGQAIASNLWGPGEPNGPQEKCVEYLNYGDSSGYMLNDLACDGQRCFICEQLV